MGNQQSSNSLPVEQKTADSIERESLIARESDVIYEEPEHGQYAEMQPEKKQRIMYDQRMVICGQEQGSFSNSQLTNQLATLYNHSAEYKRIEILTEKLNFLFAQQCDVLRELKVAENQPGKKRREVVQHWLTEVQSKEHKIQTMIEDGRGSSSQSNLSLYIESFIKEVDELIQRGIFPNGLVLLDQESTRFPLSLGMRTVGIDFQQNAEKIIRWLRNHEHCIIGVYGMGGVGKTTLLMRIHDQLLQDFNFSGNVYCVTVSQNCSVRKLQNDIAKALGLARFKEDDERKRAAVLHNRLATWGRTILILDDMWEPVSRSEVGIPLENNNCKTILSTRLYDVCRKMGCKDFVIKTEILHEGEAWDLFVDKLGHYDRLEEEAKKIASDIAKECGRLPLAITTMARSMTEVVDINEWKTTLNEVKSARDQADMKEDLFRILRYSYDRLNDRRVQQCFLSCILYGEGTKIRRTTLIDHWIDEGLLDEIKSRDAQVAKGHVILNKLESCCLLETALDYCNHRCVTMHDLIRDMGIIITREHPLFIVEAGKELKQMPEEEKWSKDLVKASLSSNEIKEIPSSMAPMSPYLTVLMLNLNPLKEIPESYFVHMKALRILDLSESSIERAPESVSDLENLRGLLFVDCKNLIYVPSVAKLTKLRTLDLGGCLKLKEAPKGLGKLKLVEKVSYIPWDVSDMVGFNKVIQSLASLSCFRFWIRDPTFKLTDDWKLFHKYEKLMFIKGGKLGGEKISLLLPPTLEHLVIKESEMRGGSLGDVFRLPGEEKILKKIILSNCRGLESISGSLGTQHGSSSLCLQLESLKIKKLPDLRSITRLGMPHSFSHLRELYISRCPRMKVVLPVKCIKQVPFPNLEIIRVEECEEVEEIFETNEANPSNPILSLPNLKALDLMDLRKLKVIFPFAEEIHLPNLESIDVRQCEEVEAMFASNKATLSNPILSSPKLKHLSLIEVPKIKVIFPFTEELHLPNLEGIWVSQCEEVEEIIESNKATPSNLILSLPNLKELLLVDLPKLGSIYSGGLLCTNLVDPTKCIDNCSRLKLRTLPGGLTFDEAMVNDGVPTRNSSYQQHQSTSLPSPF